MGSSYIVEVIYFSIKFCFVFEAESVYVALAVLQLTMWTRETANSHKSAFASQVPPTYAALLIFFLFLQSLLTFFFFCQLCLVLSWVSRLSYFLSLAVCWPLQVLCHHQHILKTGQIVGWRFCVWVDIPATLLGALPAYRRWSVQAPYPPFLGGFTRVTLVDSREFLLYSVSASPNRVPKFESSLPVLSPSIPFASPLPSHLIPPATSPPSKSILFLLTRKIHVSPLEPSLWFSLSRSVDCSMIIFYFTANICL